MRTSYDGMLDDDVPKPVLHIVKDLDGKHVDAHNRLRMELEPLEDRMLDVERQCATHTEQLVNVAKRTTDVQSLRFTPAMVAAILAMCGSIIGGSYASTWGLRDAQSATHAEILEIKTMIFSQDELRKVETKLQDERARVMAEAIREIKARGEMTDNKVNNMREQK